MTGERLKWTAAYCLFLLFAAVPVFWLMVARDAADTALAGFSLLRDRLWDRLQRADDDQSG